MKMVKNIVLFTIHYFHLVALAKAVAIAMMIRKMLSICSPVGLGVWTARDFMSGRLKLSVSSGTGGGGGGK
ncbi:hypothetical protein Acr_22g0000750 [Actinidia rufa]|uniref:Uncharacterized protein n=1 Tax=Actinidia rufa TaxID=165716 RepID=A0A7J0GIM6_9ERIC|nr:hypothetical protein Acr_22g0000750 [Actinidia rufa]